MEHTGDGSDVGGDPHCASGRSRGRGGWLSASDHQQQIRRPLNQQTG